MPTAAGGQSIPPTIVPKPPKSHLKIDPPHSIPLGLHNSRPPRPHLRFLRRLVELPRLAASPSLSLPNSRGSNRLHVRSLPPRVRCTPMARLRKLLSRDLDLLLHRFVREPTNACL